DLRRLVRKLLGLPRNHQSRAEAVRQSRAEKKTARLYRDDAIDFQVADRIHHSLDGKAKSAGVFQKRRDVFERNARLGKIRDVPDVRLKRVKREFSLMHIGPIVCANLGVVLPPNNIVCVLTLQVEKGIYRNPILADFEVKMSPARMARMPDPSEVLSTREK